MLGKIKNKLAMLKVYLNRSGTYINIINTSLILYLALSKNYTITKTYAILLVIATFFTLLIIGYCDNHLKLHHVELGIHAQRNPIFKEIINNQETIIKKIR